MSGQLVLVATPIGNLGDLSPRAVEALAAADIVCCEDSRHSGRLLAHAGVRANRLVVVNDHTEADRTDELIDAMTAGGTIALITDAGTPGISDPGSRLVAAAIAAEVTVSAVPGPAALTMALVISGFDTSRFVFEGFLPRSGSHRSERLAEVATERRTTVLYEAPHRMSRTIDDLLAACGPQRRVAVCRELTKLHEQVWRGTLGEAVGQPIVGEPRGEYVVVVDGAPAPAAPGDDDLRDDLRRELEAGHTKRDAVATVAARHHVPRRLVYDLSIDLT